MVDVATLRRLLATVPSEFVASRTELAKRLRSEGDRDGAGAVTALRRLGVADWALNVAAGEQPDLATAFGDAAVGVLDAQEAAMAGSGGSDLRDRLKALRARSAELVAAARAAAARHGQHGAGSSATDLAARLTEIGANRAAIDLLRDGLLGAADPGVADPFGVVGGSATAPASGESSAPTKAKVPATGRATRASATPTPRAAKQSPTAATDDGPPTTELERRRAERRARADAGAAVKRAASELAQADAALRRATAVEAKAADRVTDAERRLEEAIAARQAAAAARAEAEADRRRATEASDAAVAALADLESTSSTR